ncbi:hypothetical protein LCGC14_3105070 [marine sediment metagenome]|uniref:Uncharacterized protein n=1 Tax=marine sediment metagenome TaxID=412755 RepID=A0A0F8YWQ6_9ZZZZ
MEWPLVIEVALEVPTGNDLLGGGRFAHWAKKKAMREQWSQMIAAKLGVRKLKQLQKFVQSNRPVMKIHFACHRKHSLKMDNLVAGLKPVRDCLVIPDKAHPDGLGIIVYDSMKWLQEEFPTLVLVPRGMRGFTRIEISPVEVV